MRSLNLHDRAEGTPHEMLDKLLSAISDSYSMYAARGARSSTKLESLHGFFHDSAENILSDLLPSMSVNVHSIRNKEIAVNGSLYPKRVDVAVEVDGSILGGISLKFVVTNFKQNANNYFEHLLGETANLRSAGLVYGSFTVLPIEPKYLAKAGAGKRGEVVKRERLSRGNLQKYVKLHELCSDPPYRPNPLGLLVVDLDQRPIDTAELGSLGLSESELAALAELADVRRFLELFAALVRARALRNV